MRSATKTAAKGQWQRFARKAVNALAALSCCALSGQPSFAGQAGVGFSGNVAMGSTCVIVVGSDGQFVPNPQATLLSSRLPGGQPGVATIYSMLNHSVTVDAPGNFSTPANAGTGTAFSAYFSGQSILFGKTFSERPGSNQVRMRRGVSITRINVNLEAANPSGFEEGEYAAQAIIRCE